MQPCVNVCMCTKVPHHTAAFQHPKRSLCCGVLRSSSIFPEGACFRLWARAVVSPSGTGLFPHPCWLYHLGWLGTQSLLPCPQPFHYFHSVRILRQRPISSSISELPITISYVLGVLQKRIKHPFRVPNAIPAAAKSCCMDNCMKPGCGHCTGAGGLLACLRSFKVWWRGVQPVLCTANPGAVLVRARQIWRFTGESHTACMCLWTILTSQMWQPCDIISWEHFSDISSPLLPPE